MISATAATPVRCLLAAGALLGLAATGEVRAQSIRGRVLDEAGATPIAGAIVMLLRAEGERIRAVLTDGNGFFALDPPGAGSYRLRAEMIGRRSTDSDVFDVADSTVFETLVLPVEPIQLAGLEVDAARQCRSVAEAAHATHVVWAEAQKALRAESITREQALYRFAVAEYHRRLDRTAVEVVEEEVEYRTRIHDEPFGTLPPAVLARDGYVQDEADGIYVYGPDTRVLLSAEFQDTHCFALRRSDERPDLVGLRFEPVPGRELPDIEGVLWVDRESAELRSLEYRYRNIPRSLARGPYSGYSEFQRLPGGAWIVRQWWLRSPINGARRRITGFYEEAGEVLNVESLHVPADTTGMRETAGLSSPDAAAIVDTVPARRSSRDRGQEQPRVGGSNSGRVSVVSRRLRSAGPFSRSS